MYRFTKLSGKWYGYKFHSISQEEENIETFVNDSIPVVIVDDIHDFEELFDEEYEIVEED